MSLTLAFRLIDHSVASMLQRIEAAAGGHASYTPPTHPVYASVVKRSPTEIVCMCTRSNGVLVPECFVALAKDMTRDLSIIVRLNEDRPQIVVIHQCIRTLLNSVHLLLCVDEANTVHTVTYTIRVDSNPNKPSDESVNTVNEQSVIAALPADATFDAWITPQTATGRKAVQGKVGICFSKPGSTVAKIATLPFRSPLCMSSRLVHTRPV